MSTLCLIYSCIFVSSHSFSFGFSHLPYAQSCFVARWICLLKLTKYLYVSVEQAKEKACIRQQSAPHFNLGRRMTTRMQFGAFSNIFPGLRPGHYFLCWWCLVVYLISSLTKLAIIKHKINLLTWISWINLAIEIRFIFVKSKRYFYNLKCWFYSMLKEDTMIIHYCD